jgi:SAM-dependent MidA family methyltransferase
MHELRQLIKENGSISIYQFMEVAMYDKNHGYYINANPIGKDGDFITAPEISQLFGEMIGLYCVEKWIKMREPAKFNLVELGPGRGTLMADCLRATKHIINFSQAINIHLVETNIKLIELQKKALKGHKVYWHNEVSTIPTDLPLIIIANEFFDCLPINRYIKNQGRWYEQHVSIIPKAEEFCLTQIPTDINFSQSLSLEHPNSNHGAVIEICYPAIKIIQQLANIFKKTPGSILIIDYGYDYDPLIRKSYNGSLQAVKDHNFHPIFSDISRADLTAHVDFFALKVTASSNFCSTIGTVTQREFLQKLGIDIRAQNLKKNATIEQKIEIDSGLDRLINPSQMGNLFKVLEIFSNHLIPQIST